MKNIIKTLTIGLFTLFTTIVFANEDKQVTGEQLQYDSDKQESTIGTIVVSIDPQNKWQDYLDKYGLIEGENKRNERTFFIAVSAPQAVALPTNSSKFIDSRSVAYKRGVSNAKANLAEYLGTWIQSEGKLTETEISEDVSPAYIKALIKPVSTAERAHKLTDLALDDQIRRFDPEWDGTNKTREEKETKVVTQNILFKDRVSARAEAFLQGASTIFTAEGDSGGEYSVVVGIVWSFKSAKVAEAIYNPNAPLPIGKKKQLSIKDRLRKMSNDKLAATMGTRVWWDERGIPVVVSFAATDVRGSQSIAKNKTSLMARAQIQQFVAEVVESDAEKNTDEVMQYYEGGSKAGFDNSSFNKEIDRRAKLIKLSGVGTIFYKKLRHPVSEKYMVVNVMAWSPDSAKLARGLEKMSRDQETKFNATKGGTALGNSANQSLPAGGVATPGLEGVSSDPDDF